MSAEPLPVISCGLACQFQSHDHKAHVEVCDLETYVQDALDLNEFANGDVNTKWGKLRAGLVIPLRSIKLIAVEASSGATCIERLEALF